MQWNLANHLSIYLVIHVLDTNFFQQIKELFRHRYDLCKRSFVRGYTHSRTPVLKRSSGAKVNEFWPYHVPSLEELGFNVSSVFIG
jgi:hypothetical protein